MSCLGTTSTGQPCKNNATTCRWHSNGNLATPNYSGSGIIPSAITNRIRAVFEGPLKKPSSKLQSVLNNKHKIVKLELGRKPVLSAIQKTINLVSNGSYNRKKKELNYDDAWHNYLIVTLEDGTQYKMEKNHTIEVSQLTKGDLQQQRFDVPLHGKALTVEQMMKTASSSDPESFYRYRAGADNCQKFTRDMIERNGLLPPDHGKEHDVQDAPALLSSLPPIATQIVNGITDTAAHGQRILDGDGLKKQNKDLQRKAALAKLIHAML
jgi:hypothetical protein